MTYLLRANLDIEDKDPAQSPRLQAAVSTVRTLLKRGHKVVIVSHFGRPNGRRRPELSLRRFKKLLERELKEKIVFFPSFNFSNMRATISSAAGPRAFLLENLRFLPGEEKNSAALAKQLASLGDRYMNDDFATSHHKDASFVAITEFLPSVPGPTLLREVRHLSRVTTHLRKPFTLIIGGAKMKDKVGVIRHLLKKTENVLLGGGAANTFLKASGADIKASLFDPAMLSEARRMLKNKKIIMPVDYRWGGNKILDIGPKTIAKYSEIIRKSGTVVWGGPLGYFEDKRFAKGSHEIARAIASSRAFTVAGGAETCAVIIHLKLQHKIDLLSTGGGAMLAYLSGEKLPGLEALHIK